MSRTIAVIKQQMLDEWALDANSLLVTSPSKTALWNLWFYLMALWINICEQALELFVSNTVNQKSILSPLNKVWLNNLIRSFQFGYTLSIQPDFTIAYSTIDISAQIIKRYTLVGGQFLRVSKEDASGNIIPLTNAELIAFGTYMTAEMPPSYLPIYSDTPWDVAHTYSAGDFACSNGANYQSNLSFNTGHPVSDATWWAVVTTPTVYSDYPEQVTLQSVVYYDARFYLSVQNDIFAILETYFKNLPNGIFYIDDLLNAMTTVDGTKQINITEVTVRANGIAYSSSQTAYSHIVGNNAQGTTGQYLSIAGGFIQETTSTHTWSDTITFVAI